MAVNWSWKHKLGEIYVEQTHNNKVVKFKVNLYEANCLFASVYEFKEKENNQVVNKYQFYGFYSDLDHLKRCVGAVGKYDNLYDGKHSCDKWVKIRLNAYYKEVYKIATVLAKSKFKVEIYYQEPKVGKGVKK